MLTKSHVPLLTAAQIKESYRSAFGAVVEGEVKEEEITPEKRFVGPA